MTNIFHFPLTQSRLDMQVGEGLVQVSEQIARLAHVVRALGIASSAKAGTLEGLAEALLALQRSAEALEAGFGEVASQAQARE
jgi:hypothetical protein